MYFLAFDNAAKGIINANSSGNDLTVFFQDAFTNSGLMEATTGSLIFGFNDDITQTTKGEIKAAASGATVELHGVTITGGVFSTVKGSTMESTGGGTAMIEPTSPIANAGQIRTNGGSLTVTGSVRNAGTGSLLAAGGASLIITGAVTGGTATIDDTSNIGFNGPSSAKVSFQAGSTGGLLLGDATKFTGTVAGMSADPGAGIVLSNIPFADGPVVSPLTASGVLTVTDPVTHVVDKIKIVGGGSFMASHGLFGETLITDPPAGSASVPSNSPHLLAQSMASFRASSGVSTSGNGILADNHRSSGFLAAPHHG